MTLPPPGRRQGRGALRQPGGGGALRAGAGRARSTCPTAARRPSRRSTCGWSCARRCCSWASSQRVLALSQQAENMATLIGDEERLARVYTYLINYHYLKGEPDLAIGYGERCLAIGEAAADVALQALARGYMGYSHHAQGHYREAEAILRQNVEMLDGGARLEPGAQTAVSYASLHRLARLRAGRAGRVRCGARLRRPAQRAADTVSHAYGQAIAWTHGRARGAAPRPPGARAPLARAEPRGEPREGAHGVAADPVLAARPGLRPRRAACPRASPAGAGGGP